MFGQRSTRLVVETALSTKWTLQKIFLAIVIAAPCWLPAFAVTAPVISPTTGTFAVAQTVTITPPTLPIYITFDGTQPTTASTLYAAPLKITTPTQINAVAYDAGTSTYSSVTTAYLDVDASYLPLVIDTGRVPAIRLRSDWAPTMSISTGSPPPLVKWVDVSGELSSSVTHISGNAPVLASISAGRPTVRFTGSSNLSISNTRFQNYFGASYFVVTKPTSLTAGSRIFDLGRGASGDNILFRISNSGSLGEYWTYNGTSGTSVSSAAGLTAGQYQLLEASQASGSPYPATFSVNGVAGSTANINRPTDIARTQNFIGQASSGGNFYSGDIAEILIYYFTFELTASQRIAIDAFFMQKYQMLSQVPATPIISVAGGTLLQPTQIALSIEPGAMTYVTTDGTTPSSASTPYSGGPLQINYSQTIKAIAIKNGVSSSVATATYTIDSTQFPAPSPSDMTAPSITVDLPEPSQ
jgi:hypothetical protein